MRNRPDPCLTVANPTGNEGWTVYLYTPEVACTPSKVYTEADGEHGHLYRGECCLYTFGFLSQDLQIPPLERALTLYLYYKHFPQQFKERPTTRSDWELGIHGRA